MKLFVGNLSFTTTETDLQQWFEPHGAVESVTVVMDRDTGRSRGFGFIEMPNSSEADHAIAALNGSDVGGRSLTVNEARPKVGGSDRDFRGGRGGRGAGDSRSRSGQPRGRRW
ncbi:MAG: RNA-binding protein [Acidobacteria bacterium]|nr:MAG: RNA-binding protein [Acidobacteriota bacterium]